jgi:hypothetical protein
VTASGSPPADHNGLCHAWLDDSLTDPAVAAHNPRYADLIATAGGVDNVTAFCQDYLAARASAKPTPAPDGHPSDKTTGPPATPKNTH